MKITTIGRNAVGSFGVGLFLLSTFPMFGQGTIASYRLGDNTGEDWEPAIVADGSYVYALWPHYAATPYHDSSGATCIPHNAKGTGNTTIDYMYFQSSSNGGATWSGVTIPRCPANGFTVDAQLLEFHRLAKNASVDLGRFGIGQFAARDFGALLR